MSRGTNIDALKKYQQERASRSNVFYRPRESEQRVRLLPSPGEDLFFYESGYHKLGDTYYNCPSFENHECPICKKVRALYNGTQEEKALAGAIRVRRQFYYNVVVRGDEYIKNSEGNDTEQPNIKIMQVGIKLHNLVTNAILDSEIGDITDVDKGFDVIIRRKMVDQFPNYDDSVVSRKTTPLFENEEHIQYCLTHYKNPADFIKYPTVEDIGKSFVFFMENGYCPDSKSSESSDKKEEAPKEENKKEDALKEEPKSEEKPKEEAPKEEPKSEEKPKEEAKSGESKKDYDAWQKEFENEFSEDDE